MDWIEGMKRLLSYIEEHLTDAELSVETAAQHAAYSPFYLQRIFYGADRPAAVGIHPQPQNVAGRAGAARPGREGDRYVALKYGYETPESFQKAFTALPRYLAVGGQACPEAKLMFMGASANQRNA